MKNENMNETSLLSDFGSGDSSSNLGGTTFFSTSFEYSEMSEKLEGLSQTKLRKLRKLSSSILKKKTKRLGHKKYGNMNKGFTDDELKRFLNAVKNPKAHLAFFLQSHLGLRVSEVVSIRSEDIDWINNKIRISTLKANTGDFLFMPQPVRKLLLAWV